MKHTVKSFSVWSTSKIAAIVIFALVALFSWPVAALAVLSRMNHKFYSSHPDDFRTTVVMFAVFPAIEAVAVFFMTAAATWLYNVLSPRVGGIEVEIATVDPISN